MIIPQTNIRLLKSPIEIDYNNELTFSNITAQTNYFLSLPYVLMEECSYQRKEERIRFDKSFDELIGYNYCMYQNEDYSNKWFYAFINRIEYVDDSCSYVYITTDVYQTWCFDYVMKASLVDREHVEDDTIGKHTMPEGLETGDYIIQREVLNTDLFNLSNMIYVIASSLNLEATPDPVSGFPIGYTHIVSGSYSGLQYWWTDNETDLSNKINAIDNAGQADKVYSLFACPKGALSASDIANGKNHNIALTETVQYRRLGPLSMPTGLGKFRSDYEYIPKNNKLLTSPYIFLNVDNSAGSSMNINFEDVDGILTNGLECVIYLAITPSCSIKATFPYYKYNNSISDTLTGPKLPQFSWNSDAFLNWMSQQSINLWSEAIGIGLNAGLDVAGGIYNVGGVRTGLITEESQLVDQGSGVGSALFSAFNLVKTVMNHQRNSGNVRGNTNSADVVYSMGEMGFHFYIFSIKEEYARMIDDYFSMYGYKVNELKVPNLYSRRNWNYIKTVNVNLLGNIPQDDMQELKNMFNRGVTLWHNPSTFLDYSQDNSIIV